MTRRRLKPEIREVVEWAARYGWTPDEDLGGNGHLVLRHTSGDWVTLPSTPSDYRGILNTKAQIRRLSGIPSDSGPAGRYRHKPHRKRDRFDMDRALQEQAAYHKKHQVEEQVRRKAAAEVARLTSLREGLLAQLAECHPRREQGRALELAARIVDVERRLERLRDA